MKNQILDSEFNEEEKPILENPNIRYAGFWIRVGATFIDFLVLMPVVFLNYYNLLVVKNLPLLLLTIVIPMIYKPFMEYKYGATLGKMAVSVKVVDYNYSPISLEQAATRYIPWFINVAISAILTITLFNAPDFYEINELTEIGYATQNQPFYLYSQAYNFVFLLFVIFVAFNFKKQGLHDLMAKTYCIYTV